MSHLCPSSWWNYNTDINILGSIDFFRNWRLQYRSLEELSRETSLELISDIINPAYSIHSGNALGLKQKLVHWDMLLFMCTCRCYKSWSLFHGRNKSKGQLEMIIRTIKRNVTGTKL